MTVEQFYSIFLKYPEICTDSRKAKQGSIFFAISGDTFDGNNFVEKALEGGCKWAVVDNPKAHKQKHTVLVDNALAFLQDLAKHHRSQLKIPVIGLTGTNGKTTTKELIVAVLNTKHIVVATIGNQNNHIGVPLTILRATTQTEILVVEMGANHEGEIKFLADIAQPNVGLITNIGRAHLEGFGSFEGVVRTKKELYDFLFSNSGTIFVNQEDELLLSLLKDNAYIPYGNGSVCTPHSVLNHGLMLDFEFDLNPIGISERFIIKTQLVGEYNLSNALAALSIGNYFGVPWEFGANAISEYSPGMNRSEYRITDSNNLILDAYNANPTSMMEAINNFARQDMTNKIAILGDMRELGNFSRQLHVEVLENAVKKDIELILIGKEFSAIASTILSSIPIRSYLSVDEYIPELKKHPIKGRDILLKGSRGIQLEKLVPFL
ncbi:MAG: UDP-N-acetylmuramoyl-tripeptide--D-alanyl-D-alanine ligase [Bacteroidales bacterium]|nr:UDP-N-acetylmuramoyl-tripeptide--D-alanyl-D-alanine ligase [Bacteroidales bacterium]